MNIAATTLADGRRLAWCEFGDPRGHPILYCHGFPASGTEAGFTDRAGATHGARIIAPDRPGYGASDRRPGRSISDWPRDAAALLDRLGIDAAPVIGVSGGGPYAFACAAARPARFPRVATFGALGPLAAPGSDAGMTAFNRGCIRLARNGHERLHAALFHALAALIRISPANIFRLVAAGESGSDRELFREPAIRAIWTESLRRSVLQGAAAPIEELRLYVAPWQLRLADVGVPVRLWHGLDDAVVPPQHARHLAGRLPWCELEMLRGEGHFTTPVRYAGGGIEWLLREDAGIPLAPD